jgi:hypothetical protein
MRRMELKEIHDHERFPKLLRDLVTDAMEAMWDFIDCYRGIVPRLRQAMEQSGTRQVLDLCSGGGGPWLRLHRRFEHVGYPVEVCLTDKYPNRQAFEQVKRRSGKGLSFSDQPVNAMRISATVRGFRTMFSSFHHFRPEEASAMLRDAVEQGRGIAVFEAAKSDLRTIVMVCGVPFLIWAVTPFIRPFRWSRLLFTYLVPVIPFVVWIDGILSCLRAYSEEDLCAMTATLGPGHYRWEFGEDRTSRVGITYLIGFPEKVPAEVEAKQNAKALRA